jgi:hypothetical protein
MEKGPYKVRAKIWLYPGAAAWHFVTIPAAQSARIKKTFGAKRRAWGSLPVTVTLGKTRWKTSIFPDKKAGAYLLPLKADIRKKENVSKGDAVSLLLEVLA